jgi:hypothetical protein
MDALLRRLLRAAFRRGLAGDWTWMLIGITAYILRRALKDKDDLVTSFRISPGDQFLITLRDPHAPAADPGEPNDTPAGSAGDGGAGGAIDDES